MGRGQATWGEEGGVTCPSFLTVLGSTPEAARARAWGEHRAGGGGGWEQEFGLGKSHSRDIRGLSTF